MKHASWLLAMLVLAHAGRAHARCCTVSEDVLASALLCRRRR